MKLTSEDIALIRKYEEIMNRGYYVSGNEVTETYNRVLGKNIPSTNCSSCIRRRISELVEHMRRMLRLEEIEASKKEEIVDKEENKPSTEDMKARMARVRSARKKSKKEGNAE